MDNEKFIVYGAKEFGYAPITSSGESQTFGTPVMIDGMRSFSSSIEQTDTPIYADDKIYATIKGAKKRSGEAKVLFIPASYSEVALGYKKMANGMVVDNGTAKNHCVFYIETARNADTGEETKILNYFYNVTASEGDIESVTLEDEVEAKEMSINYSCSNSAIAKDDQGNGVAYARLFRTEENAKLFDTFKTKVILPTDSVTA